MTHTHTIKYSSDFHISVMLSYLDPIYTISEFYINKIIQTFFYGHKKPYFKLLLFQLYDTLAIILCNNFCLLFFSFFN